MRGIRRLRVRHAIRALPAGRAREKARLMMMQALARRGGRTLTTDVYGNTFLVDRAHFLDAYLLVDGSYERENIELLLRRSAVADLFVDVGANMGLFSLPLAQHLPVVAFEPDPDNVQQLRANVWLNAASVDVRKLALSDCEGTSSLHLSRGTKEGNFGISNPGTSSLTPHAGHHGEFNTAEVFTTTLDSALGISGKRVLVKIDVEGHELNVAAGAERTMADNDCLILAEVFEDHLAEWDELMRSRSYEPVENESPAYHYCVYAKRDSFSRRAD